jgi:predicted DNA-binding transcriptional regulator AlpA
VRPETVRLDDLLDAHQVAELLGLSGASTVRAYAALNDDFPRPVLPREPRRGSASYWWRPDLIAWRDTHPPRRRAGGDAPPPP